MQISRTRKPKSLKDRDGSVLVGVVALCAVMGVASAGFIGMSRNSVSLEVDAHNDARAVLAAEAGLLLGANKFVNHGGVNGFPFTMSHVDNYGAIDVVVEFVGDTLRASVLGNNVSLPYTTSMDLLAEEVEEPELPGMFIDNPTSGNVGFDQYADFRGPLHFNAPIGIWAGQGNAPVFRGPVTVYNSPCNSPYRYRHDYSCNKYGHGDNGNYNAGILLRDNKNFDPEGTSVSDTSRDAKNLDGVFLGGYRVIKDKKSVYFDCAGLDVDTVWLASATSMAQPSKWLVGTMNTAPITPPADPLSNSDILPVVGGASLKFGYHQNGADYDLMPYNGLHFTFNGNNYTVPANPSKDGVIIIADSNGVNSGGGFPLIIRDGIINGKVTVVAVDTNSIIFNFNFHRENPFGDKPVLGYTNMTTYAASDYTDKKIDKNGEANNHYVGDTLTNKNILGVYVGGNESIIDPKKRGNIRFPDAKNRFINKDDMIITGQLFARYGMVDKLGNFGALKSGKCTNDENCMENLRDPPFDPKWDDGTILYVVGASVSKRYWNHADYRSANGTKMVLYDDRGLMAPCINFGSPDADGAPNVLKRDKNTRWILRRTSNV